MKRAILVMVLLCGCTAVAQDVGLVTIFRLPDHHRGWKPIAFCDGKRVAAIQGGKYVKMVVSSGKHTFSSNNTKSGVDLDVKPGGDYFLQVSGTTGPLSDEGKLELVDTMQSRYQLNRLEPLKATEVAGGVCRGAPAGQ